MAGAGKRSLPILGHASFYDRKANLTIVFTDPEIAWASVTAEEAKALNIQPEFCSERVFMVDADVHRTVWALRVDLAPAEIRILC